MVALDQQISTIAEFAARHLQGRMDTNSLRPLVKPTTEAKVADATSAYYVDGTSRSDDFVLIVSPPDFPDAVEESASAALRAGSLLGKDLGRSVCAPLLIERAQGRSFALYPRLEGFSQNRYVRMAQKHRAAPAILRWLNATLDYSKIEHAGAEERESRFVQPLQTLMDDADLPSPIRSAAEASAKAVQAGRVRTVTCLQHGDFWFGNIMFERSAAAWMAPLVRPFRVIDWGSSKPDGYPGIDAVRFLLSTFGPGRYSVRAFDAYCRRAKLTATDASVSCLSSLGRLAGELNEFPKQNFIGLVGHVHDFLDRCRALEALQSAVGTVA